MIGRYGITANNHVISGKAIKYKPLTLKRSKKIHEIRETASRPIYIFLTKPIQLIFSNALMHKCF